MPANGSPAPSPPSLLAVEDASRSTRTRLDPVLHPAPLENAPAGSRDKTPVRLPSSPPSRSKITAMWARAAKARGSGRSSQKKDAPPTKISSTPPPPIALFDGQVRTTEEEGAVPTSVPIAGIPSGPGSSGATFDEVVSRFAASCPGGDLMNMAKLPTDILVAKGASVLAEVMLILIFIILFYYLAEN